MPFLEPHSPTGLLEAMAGPSAVPLYHAKSKGFNTLNREILIASPGVPGGPSGTMADHRTQCEKS